MIETLVLAVGVFCGTSPLRTQEVSSAPLLGSLLEPATAALAADETSDPPLAPAAPTAGGWHFGGGLAWSLPLNTSVREQRQTLAVSLDVTREWEHGFAGLTLLHGANFGLNSGNPTSWGTPWDAFALHGAFIPWSTPWASLYVGGGLGLMLVGFRMTDEDSNNSFWFHWNNGPAVLAEAGLLFFRDRPWGRVGLVGQLVVPLFTVVPASAPQQQHISIATLGLRAQL